MMIDANGMHFSELNERIRAHNNQDIVINNCLGQRFIGSGYSQGKIDIHGTPGNGLGAYLNGGTIVAHANVQDAVGDTMNEGCIVVHGNAGDTLGYAMRGGSIFVQGDSGYRTGIHMKQYQTKKPVIIIGGNTGSFLGEYMAGGLIVVLGLGQINPRLGYFTGVGMHGGKIFIRCQECPERLPSQVVATVADVNAKQELAVELKAYATVFGLDYQQLIADNYYLLQANDKNPYTCLYIGD